MRVRSLRDETDVRELIVAHGRAWRVAYEGLLPQSAIERVADPAPDADHIETEFGRLRGYGANRVLVTEDSGGTVRGYAVFRWGPDETKDSVVDGAAELKELYVDPDHWNGGMGTALLEWGISRLPEEVESLALEVLSGNDIGIRFYERRGFEYVDDGTFEVDGQTLPTRVYRRPVG